MAVLGKAPVWLITFCHKYPPADLIGYGVLHFLAITAGWMLHFITWPLYFTPCFGSSSARKSSVSRPEVTPNSCWNGNGERRGEGEAGRAPRHLKESQDLGWDRNEFGRGKVKEPTQPGERSWKSRPRVRKSQQRLRSPNTFPQC